MAGVFRDRRNERERERERERRDTGNRENGERGKKVSRLDGICGTI